MGDDSSRKLESSKANNRCGLDTTTYDTSHVETTEVNTGNQSIRVLYSHEKTIETLKEDETRTIHCRSFDDLLILLEEDLVETIWFDQSVKQHERAYITGWAKIFRPDLKAKILPSQNPIH